MKHMLTYIKETIDYEITYHHGLSLQPIGFVDSDYANNYDTRWSTDEHVFIIRRGSVLWSTKKQKTVVIFTTEVEYMAVSRAVQQAI